MLKPVTYQFGLTLIELVIGLGIAAMLLGMGAPNFVDWIRNTRIRTAAEAFQNGIQLARAEAVRRNTPVRFQVTNTVTGACAPSSTGTNWLVSLNDVTGKCAVAPTEPPAYPNAPDPNNPYIIQVRSAEDSANTVVAAGQSVITFNGLGRVTPLPANNITLDITGASGTCASLGGSLRCLKVIISTNGQVRLCDPAVTRTDDPKRCPSPSPAAA